MPAPAQVAAPAPVNAPTKAPIVQIKPTTPAPNGATPAAPPTDAAPAPKLKVKVNGEFREYTQAEAERLLSRVGFADQTVKQAKEALAAARKAQQEQAERESIWDDDEKLEAELLKRGKLDALARKRLEAKMREAEMSPEQKAIAERDAKIAELERKTKAAEEEKQQQTITAHAERMRQHVIGMLDEAWERAGFERGNADTFSAVQATLKEFRDLGLLPKRIEEWTPALVDRICEQARESVEGSFKQLESAVLKGLKGQALYDRLGKSVVDELNRYQVELIKGGGAKKAAPQAQALPAVEKPSDYMTVEQAREFMRKGGKP